MCPVWLQKKKKKEADRKKNRAKTLIHHSKPGAKQLYDIYRKICPDTWYLTSKTMTKKAAGSFHRVKGTTFKTFFFSFRLLHETFRNTIEITQLLDFCAFS